MVIRSLGTMCVLNIPFRHWAFIWRVDLKISKIVLFNRLGSKILKPVLRDRSLCNEVQSLHKIHSDGSWIFSSFALFVLPQKCQRSGLQLKSLAIKLCRRAQQEFRFRYWGWSLGYALHGQCRRNGSVSSLSHQYNGVLSWRQLWAWISNHMKFRNG